MSGGDGGGGLPLRRLCKAVVKKVAGLEAVRKMRQQVRWTKVFCGNATSDGSESASHAQSLSIAYRVGWVDPQPCRPGGPQRSGGQPNWFRGGEANRTLHPGGISPEVMSWGPMGFTPPLSDQADVEREANESKRSSGSLMDRFNGRRQAWATPGGLLRLSLAVH